MFNLTCEFGESLEAKAVDFEKLCGIGWQRRCKLWEVLKKLLKAFGGGVGLGAEQKGGYVYKKWK